MEQTLSFQRAEEEDRIDQIAKIANETWHEYYDGILEKEQIDYMVEKFQSSLAIKDQIETKEYEYYAIQFKDQIIGYLAIICQRNEKKLFLSKLYIGKQYRGKGFANQSFLYLEQLAKEQNLLTIWLTVNRNNSNSIAIYMKKGFCKVREEITDIGNGYVMDDYIMEKKL